ncbi:MAG: Pr6Pr family membrane protein [Clostridia bacterium]|nr:Pr6Pr family membrane protein [Clostridia bacterium]
MTETGHINDNPITKNKPIGMILTVIALFGFAVFVYRLCCYIYEYDAQFYPVDYGRFNILSYFTVQSNFFAYVYFLFAGLAILGVKKAEKIGFHSGVGTLVTLYVVVAGAVYCGGLPFGFAPPFTFDTPYHRMTVVIQIFYHMFMPAAALLLYLFPFRNDKLGKRTVLLSGVYPIVYSVVSMARGRLFTPTYYPYPFYDPQFVWRTLFGEKPINLFAAYAIIGAAILVLGGGLFMALAAILVKIHNKRIKE